MTDKPKIQFETFREIGSYECDRLTSPHPYCFNGVVAVRKYRVTIEEVDEPKEVIASRLIELWEACGNHHHYMPLEHASKQIGITLDHKNFGSNRKKTG